MFKQFIKIENSYGTFLISVLLVTIYMMSFGIISFHRYFKGEITINKEMVDQQFIDPPGKFNETFNNNYRAESPASQMLKRLFITPTLSLAQL